MTKHTKGPWLLASNGKSILFREEGHPFRLVAEAHHAVFHDGTGQGSLSDSEVEANARLIAAAPDLLESLKYALEAINGNYHMRQSKESLIRELRYQIAKAEGLK